MIAEKAPEETHIRIDILYRRLAQGLDYQVAVGFRGAKPAGYGPRVTCGILFIALGCFDLCEGISRDVGERYTEHVVVNTDSRQIYSTKKSEARDVVSTVIAQLASDAGVPASAMTEAMVSRLIGEAVEVLNNDIPVKINATGGAA